MKDANFFKQDTLVDILAEKKAPTLPKQIGPYPIESLLEEGGMSVLYLGINPESHEPLAIKVLKKEYLANQGLVQRFLQESEIIAMTDHPNIIKLFGQGTWEGGLYIAMEFIQGISLRQMILQNSLTLKRSLEIVLQISYALFHLHAHGVIHRDLKPENILLTESGGIKVIDFGIAQLQDQSNKDGVNQLIGTPVYMSPEQKKDPSCITYSSDIYSLGIVTYELILGKLSHGVIHLSLLPVNLQKILKKALATDLNERYQDIADFINDLSNYLESERFEKDVGKSDYTSALFEELKDAQRLFIPKTSPRFSKLDIGLVNSTNLGLISAYYDFMELENGAYAIILAESSSKGASTLLYTALFKGMTLSLLENLSEPSKFAAKINKIISKQYPDLFFNMSLLVLIPNKQQLRFISCGFGSLWYMPSSLSSVRKLSSSNIAIGIDGDAEFTEINSNWNIGDRLLLHTFKAIKENSEDLNTGLSEDDFQNVIKETIYLSPQKQADAILRKMTSATKMPFTEIPITLMSVARTS
jgi:serine/threonine protein kinase